MTATLRLLTLLGLTLAVMVGSSIPASATFGDNVAVATDISTGVVAAPTQLEAKLYCTTTVDPVTGVGTTTKTLKIEWWRSATRGVTGYLITAHPATGAPYELVRTGSTDETVITADEALISSQPRFTVTTLTSYGWTNTTSTTGMTSC